MPEAVEILTSAPDAGRPFGRVTCPEMVKYLTGFGGRRPSCASALVLTIKSSGRATRELTARRMSVRLRAGAFIFVLLFVLPSGRTRYYYRRRLLTEKEFWCGGLQNRPHQKRASAGFGIRR